jgi:uncharacterized protein (TIGR02145 family)
MKTKTSLVTIAILFISLNSRAQVTGTYTDSRDGKVYKTVTIGTQTWMAENLAYKAENGCCVYNDDVTNVATYGYLYNWETAKTVCPQGWHLPTDAEWNTLTNYLGGKSISGGKLKSKKKWARPNTGATNRSGFTALPGGSRDYNGTFSRIGSDGYWWSSNEYSTTGGAWYVHMFCDTDDEDRDHDSKKYSFSVRCLMD